MTEVSIRKINLLILLLGLSLLVLSSPALASAKIGSTSSIFVDGNHAYISYYYSYPSFYAQGGFQIIDISNPFEPSYLGSYHDKLIRDAFYDGSYAYIIDSDRDQECLRIISIKNPSKPKLLNSITFSYRDISRIFVKNHIAFICGYNRPSVYGASPEGYLHIMNLESPDDPLFLGSVQFPAYGNCIQVEDNLAYLGAERYFHIYNVSNLSNPVLLGAYELNYTSNINSMRIFGNYAYVSSARPSGTQMDIIDISNSSNPVSVSQLENCGSYLSIENNYAYVLVPNVELNIIDITNKTNPHKIVTYNAPGGDVFVSNAKVYMTCFEEGLLILDVSDPTNPIFLNQNLINIKVNRKDCLLPIILGVIFILLPLGIVSIGYFKEKYYLKENFLLLSVLSFLLSLWFFTFSVLKVMTLYRLSYFFSNHTLYFFGEALLIGIILILLGRKEFQIIISRGEKEERSILLRYLGIIILSFSIFFLVIIGALGYFCRRLQ